MRTDPGIEAANTVGKSSRPTANHRAHAFRFPDSGPGRGRPGTPPGSALADHVPGGRTAGTEVARTPGPRGAPPGTMPPPASEPELNRFYQPPRQKCPETDVSPDG